MSTAKVVRERIEEDGKVFSALYLELKNACIIFLSEGEESLGTLAMSVPPRGHMVGPPLSSILIGDRNLMVARLLAERVASIIGKIVLVSVFIKTINEMVAGPILLRLIERVMKRRSEPG